MKNHCIFFLLSIIISVTAVCCCVPMATAQEETSCEQYLRIHIRADSNDEQAQAVKYLVRDAVVEYLTPIVAECESKEEATQRLQTKLRSIEAVANDVLQTQAFSYQAQAALKRETFPTRVYGEYTLPAGEYTALILRLGEGKGDNWWCVVYPPLCFVAPSGQNVEYKSKIAEIIRRWKNG